MDVETLINQLIRVMQLHDGDTKAEAALEQAGITEAQIKRAIALLRAA
jgi:hypothetical protein